MFAMIRASARSTATPDRVWSLASDVEHWAERLPTVTLVRPLGTGPLGVGSRYELRQPGLPKAVWEVTDWQPQARSFTWVSKAAGIRSTATHSVHADNDGSRLDLTFDWSGPLARIVELLLGRKARGMVETEAETFTRLAAQG
jgi:carbon monoxide dehydrogenase subunit G